MMKTTRWSPDTCGCVIDYQWDTDLPSEERVHTAVASTPCPLHADQPDHVAVHATVLAENTGKNKLVAKAAELSGVHPSEVVWAFDDQRQIAVDVPGGFTPEQQDELTAFIARK